MATSLDRGAMPLQHAPTSIKRPGRRIRRDLASLICLMVAATLLLGATPARAAQDSTTTVTSSKNPVRVGEPIAFTATVMPDTATGTVQFKINGENAGNATLTGGKARVSMSSSPPAGTHTVTAHYSGDATFGPSSGILEGGQKVLAKDASTTTVTATPNPVVWGEGVIFTAAVTPSTATGTVQFKLNGTNLMTGTLSGGKATVGVSHAPGGAGTHTLTADYSGDANVAPSTGTLEGGFRVLKRDSAVQISSDRNPAHPSEKITLTATVVPQVPVGAVQFQIDGANYGSPVAVGEDGKARTEVGNLSTGNHTVAAHYSGNENVNASSGSLAGGQKVVPALSTKPSTTQLFVDPASGGQTPRLVATVGPAGATGTVQFKIDGANVGSPVPLIGGVARSPEMTGLSRGRHTVAADYSGDNEFKSSSSSETYDHQPPKIDTNTSFTLDKTAGEQRTVVVATVRPATATGTVQFKLNGANVGRPVPLRDGVARSQPMDISKGSPSIQATYSGDENHKGSGAGLHIDRILPEPKPTPSPTPTSGGGKSGSGSGGGGRILPRTGETTVPLALAALALVGTGLVMVRRARREGEPPVAG